MTMSIWVFLLIVGAALLTGHGMRAKAAAAVFFLVGIVIGGSYLGTQIHTTLDTLATVFS